MKFISSPFAISSYDLITRAIRGLEWMNNYDKERFVYALLSLPDVQSSLSQANAALFLVGTNSMRILPARQIISQIQQIIILVQQNYPHLNQPKRISIPLAFTCFKTTRRFSTEASLMSNINFHIENHHLAYDNMHIQKRFWSDIFESIIKHCDRIVVTISASDEEKSSKHSKRSRDALDRQNKKNHQKMKMKQQHKIMRKIHHQRTISKVKLYVGLLNIRYARIQSITNSILRVLFNNQDGQDFADNHLGIDKFNKNCYKEFINSHPS